MTSMPNSVEPSRAQTCHKVVGYQSTLAWKGRHVRFAFSGEWPTSQRARIATITVSCGNTRGPSTQTIACRRAWQSIPFWSRLWTDTRREYGAAAAEQLEHDHRRQPVSASYLDQYFHPTALILKEIRYRAVPLHTRRRSCATCPHDPFVSTARAIRAPSHFSSVLLVLSRTRTRCHCLPHRPRRSICSALWIVLMPMNPDGQRRPDQSRV